MTRRRSRRAIRAALHAPVPRAKAADPRHARRAPARAGSRAQLARVAVQAPVATAAVATRPTAHRRFALTPAHSPRARSAEFDSSGSRVPFGQQLRAVAQATLAILGRYLLSPWFLAETVLVLGLMLLAFRAPFTPPYFFTIAGLALSLLTVASTYVLVHAIAPLKPLHLSMTPSDRSSSGTGVVAPVVAAALIRTLQCGLLLGFVFVGGQMSDASRTTLVPGMIGLIANCVLLATITVTLATPFVNRVVQLAFLAWVGVALASYHATGTLAPLLLYPRLPLLPFAACYAFGVTNVIDHTGLLALGIEALYCLALTLHAHRVFVRRTAVVAAPAI